VLIGLVASEAEPQLVDQQPSYIYPGGHPVYKMAGIPYVYSSVPNRRAGRNKRAGMVSCGGHEVPTCGDCGGGEGWCNGDCSWYGGECIQFKNTNEDGVWSVTHALGGKK